MFKHILVPVDFSERNPHALKIAASIARLEGGSVSVLHVIELIADTGFDEFKDFYERLMAQAQGDMAELLAPFEGAEAPMKHSIHYGHRVRAILEFATRNDVDLIVLNSHKVDPSAPGQGWGTISYKVGILSQCPVMLVK